MSIYATLWSLKFPKFGDYHFGCEWIEVIAQGVPPHIGSPTPGQGYEDGDPYAGFLPEPVVTNSAGEAEYMRAVVFITESTRKGTPRSGQEFVDALLTLTGEEYAKLSFQQLHDRICKALRGDRPAVVFEFLSPGGEVSVHFEDGTHKQVKKSD
jgi:hypothetical protein